MDYQELLFKLKDEQVSFRGVEYSHEDIHRVVDIFYRRVAEDRILKEPFKTVSDWPEHIKNLTHFWWARLGGEPYLSIQYNPMLKHFEAGFNRDLLTRWLGLFHQTLEENLNEEQYSMWKWMSTQMGEGLHAGNELYKKRAESGLL